jgi:hypothetical protein
VTSMNLQSRLLKLESRNPRAGEMLLIWCKPGETAKSAIDSCRHLFQPMDRVALAQWYSENDPPRPAWHRNFPRDLTDLEFESLNRMIREAVAAVDREASAASENNSSGHRWSDAELWYQLLRIENHANCH